MVAPQGSLKTYPELMVSQWDPAGPETAGEKDGPEEEEDYDSLTQDEEDEMSSASEESVLCPGTPGESWAIFFNSLWIQS